MNGALIAIAATLLLAAYQFVACLIWPFRECRRCKGVGKFRARWGGRGWRRCPRCKGSGERLRIGRRIWNLWRRLRADA